MDRFIPQDRKKLLIAAGLASIPALWLSLRYFSKRTAKNPASVYQRKISQLAKQIKNTNPEEVNIVRLTSSKTVRIKEGDLSFDIHYVNFEAMKRKDNSSLQKEDPFLPPFEKGKFIADIGQHRLIFNKFPVF